jgi:hypothetical protein
MSYQQKFLRVKTSLINSVKETIIDRYNYNNEFFMWSYSSIKDDYIRQFKNEFSQYMNQNIEQRLWFAGYNISFAVQTFIDINPNYTLSKLLNFVETFITKQLDDFDNWCDEIILAMPDEEENPSYLCS